MPRIATQSAQSTRELTVAQESVISALLAGKSITEAATVGGVDRCTVHRWLKTDFHFQAEFNGRRQALRNGLRDRLLVIAEQAVGVVEKCVIAGDGKTALALLKGLGMLSGEPVEFGSDNARRLQLRAKKADQDISFDSVLCGLN